MSPLGHLVPRPTPRRHPVPGPAKRRFSIDATVPCGRTECGPPEKTGHRAIPQELLRLAYALLIRTRGARRSDKPPFRVILGFRPARPSLFDLTSYMQETVTNRSFSLPSCVDTPRASRSRLCNWHCPKPLSLPPSSSATREKRSRLSFRYRIRA